MLEKLGKQCYTFSDGNGQEACMKTEFDITLNSKDMYYFSMHHTYTGSQGITSIIMAVLCFAAAVYTYGSVELMNTILYAGFGVLFLLYVPVNLYLRSKRQVLTSDVLQNALHYRIDETGIHTSQKEASADLPWEQVYKVISTRHNVLIYSNRINAYIIPRSQIAEEYDTIRQIAAANVPKFRFKMK